MRVKVEVCVTSVHEAEAAEACGADGVEICTWLACGGITPSNGLVDAVRSVVEIPVRVLVRPTPGGFVYTGAEAHAILIDAEVFGGGALGLVVGGLTQAGAPDVALMREAMRVAPESEVTFHRAIDHAAEMLLALDVCLDLGVHRVLSSGGETLALDGARRLNAMVERAGDRLLIAAAGGINPDNVVEIVERAGVREVHFAAQLPVKSKVRGAAMSSGHAGVSFETEPDREKIDGVLNALVKAGLR
ncbi:MAG: copper homeostasis protein CutC [Flavobacteriales bacterium]|nr:copper homeostasis protein CutC [Flavobacteriales bacterium]